MRYTIETRGQYEVNSYDGCLVSSEFLWTPWKELEYNVDPERVESRLAFWRELNNYSISQRGEEARREFRVQEIKQGAT